MPQAGIHAMVGMATRKWTGAREWLLLGAVLGSVTPDLDNLAVAVATLTGGATEGLHRTFTHSVFFIAVVVAVFYAIGALKKDARWTNLGYGLGLGILLHILVDLVIWFNGVYMFWPLGGEIGLWKEYPAGLEWLREFNEQAAEFLFFGVYLWALGSWARKFGTDGDFAGKLRFWTWFEFVLFAIFFILLLTGKIFAIISGGLYLVSILMVFFVTIRMRKTLEAA
ncbi:MAG TPA: metal-dependent hydrolase [Anaerolineales bacterium]|nr:metal-dependent hydrolase [Anaerolineales bacterium]